MPEEQSQADWMPNAAEAASITAELMGQEVSTQVEAPVVTGQVTPQGPAEIAQAPGVSQAPDYAALDAEIAKLGYEGKTILDAPGIIADIKRGMNEAQRNANEIRQRYQPFDPLVNEIHNNPAYAKFLEEQSREFYSGDDGSGAVPHELAQTLDPLVNRLNQMETKLANQEMQEQIAGLKAKGYDVTPEDETAVWNKVIETGSRNVVDHYWAVKGPSLVQAAAKNAKQQTVDGIRKANESYNPVPSAPAPEGKAFDARTATPAEVEAEMMRDLANMM
jgi:hypothetical protein